MKRLMWMLCAVVIVLGGFMPFSWADNVTQIVGDGNTVVFVDVPDNHWAKDEIYYFASNGIVQGVGDNRFNPNGSVTREQFAKMLVLAFGAPIDLPTEATFADVSSTTWSYPYIETCKDFMTGYANIFGGKPSFRPTLNATREDIAVALVRMMGLTDADVNDWDYAAYMFNDSDDISPQLMGYISLATERKLLTGYSDGNFYPNRGITRAETVALINRATKQAMSNITSDVKLDVSVEYGRDPKNAVLTIVTEEGAKVTVNGESVTISSDWYDVYSGTYTHTFTEEGKKTFVVEAKKLGKTTTKEVEAKFEVGLPILKITKAPTEVKTKDVVISGTMEDDNYGLDLYINGELIASKHNSWESKYWSQSYTLKEGANTFDFVLKNTAGKEYKETRVIQFNSGGPVLEITSFPTNVSEKSVTIRGTMNDPNFGVDLYINGKVVASKHNSWQSSHWSQTYTLKEGVNTFDFVLKNTQGKESKESRTINFTVAGPKLQITNLPSEVSSNEVTIRGTMDDDNYGVDLYINGSLVASKHNSWQSSHWSETFNLVEGNNTFNFSLKNTAGKETLETRVVKFTPASPVVVLDEWLELSETGSYTVYGGVNGETKGLTFYINDQVVSTGYNNRFSKTLSLSPGDNTFVFRAVNAYGKSHSVAKTIKFAEVNPPTVTVNEVAGSTTETSIVISGLLEDALDSNVTLRVNDAVVFNGTGNWSTTVNLVDGDNTIIITATNRFGKSTTVVKNIFKSF